MKDDLLLKLFFAKLQRTKFKIWKEESPLVGEPYTVMHIESVIDILDLTAEIAAVYGYTEPMNFAIMLKQDILKSIGRDTENE